MGLRSTSTLFSKQCSDDVRLSVKLVIGCFALTEMGHGSNVREIQTEATYDKASESFIINTPCLEATKWWIGGAAKTSNIATVFAQLIVDGNNHGVQAFIVPLRDANHDPLPGVTIGDCGPKPGLVGRLDNARTGLIMAFCSSKKCAFRETTCSTRCWPSRRTAQW